MSNSFNLSSAPDIAALEAKVDIVDTVVDLIRSADVPDIQTNINANETKIDTIDGIVDAIKLKTDVIPQKVRGKITCYEWGGVTDVWHDICNETGQGKLYFICIKVTDGGDTITAKLTVDGHAFSEITHTGDTVIQYIFPICDNIAGNLVGLGKIPDTGQFPPLFNLSFDTSLLFQVKRSAGSTAGTPGKIVYMLDDL